MDHLLQLTKDLHENFGVASHTAWRIHNHIKALELKNEGCQKYEFGYEGSTIIIDNGRNFMVSETTEIEVL